jgi:DNA-binding LytR/AlgR family response regulator
MEQHRALRILIVEDEPLLVMDVEMMVEDAGHEVVAEAASLYDVEAMDPALEPDLAFVDMHLARGTNGLAVSALIQQRWTKTLIVFVTANPAMIPDGFAGAHGVLPKPFSRNGFVSTLAYLQQGICRPPPQSLKPADFVAAQSLLDGWNVR